MKNILTILSESGIEIPEEKKETIDKVVLENYKTIVDYNNVKAKRDDYKGSLEGVEEKLKAFESVDVENLQGQITTLTEDLQAERDARAEDIRKNELEKSVETFLAGKEFVNPITQKALREQLAAELDKDSAKGKSIDDIFTGLITDEEGKQIENILVSEAEKNKARFTTSKTPGSTGTITKADFLAMSLDDRIKLKDSDPELYQSLRK